MLYQMEMTAESPNEVIDSYNQLALGGEDEKWELYEADPNLDRGHPETTEEPGRGQAPVRPSPRRLSEAVLPFAEHLVNGVHFHRDQIDDMIAAASENWRLARMSIIDRNVLRIALFEMLYCLEIPPKVSINEAIDLGKTFGSPDSGAFINGILDRLLPEASRVREEQASGA